MGYLVVRAFWEALVSGLKVQFGSSCSRSPFDFWLSRHPSCLSERDLKFIWVEVAAIPFVNLFVSSRTSTYDMAGVGYFSLRKLSWEDGVFLGSDSCADLANYDEVDC